MNTIKINLALYLCIGIMAIVNLFCTNALATQGVEINGLYQHSKVLEKTNQELEGEINKHNRLSYIQEIAIGQGYKRISEIGLVSTTSLLSYDP
ncbi:hypothetical protein KKG65_00620 [Patescibacteria group bacterium]|nr:hypothetical protein [Patescibacteria group bacterium]